MIRATDIPVPRAWPPALALLGASTLAVTLAMALAQPARADTRADVAAPRHHGVAFAAPKGARARIVEPDGRIVATDGVSDLVAPASIASRQAQNAIARLISAESVDRGPEAQSLATDAAPESAEPTKAARPRREPSRGLRFGSVTPGV